MNIRLIILALCIPFLSAAQDIPAAGQLAYFSFNNCESVDSTNELISNTPSVTANIVRQDGDFMCDTVCGVLGNSIRFNGINQQLIFFSGFSGVFDTDPFGISFYIRPDPTSTVVNLFTNREECNDVNAFAMDYNPSANTINVTLSEETGINGNVSGTLDPDFCWQHILFTREGAKSSLYINGVLKDERIAPQAVNILNSSAMVFSSGLCSQPYQGLLDELVFYKRALSNQAIERLYTAPGKINNRDTSIFIGGSVDINLNSNCADTYSWSPVDFVDNPLIAEPTMDPDTTTTYTIEMTDGSCTSRDQITITVIDPDELDCTEVFLPNAFTPNNDNLNDLYRINNPYTIDQLLSFEVLDRWGSRVFMTDDVFEGWDGTFQGQDVNPGVLLYRVRFVCKSEEIVQAGSITLLR